MRRPPYQQRYQKAYVKLASKHKPQPLDSTNTTFKIQINKISDESSSPIRDNGSFVQHKLSRLIFSRPYTTHKANSFAEFRRQNHQTALNRSQHERQLFINTLKQQQSQREPNSEQNKGRIYRGSSWKYDEKLGKDLVNHLTSRYSGHKKSDSFMQFPQNSRRGGRGNGMLELSSLIGQNLKKPQPLSTGKEDDYFQYVMRFSYRTKKGHIPSNRNKVNQDAYIINPNINSKTWQHLFAVCDGHGPLGHHVSNFIKNSLPYCVSNLKSLEKYPKESLTKAFEMAYQKLLKQSNIDMSFSGSTIISCYLQQNKLVCANVGDSRAVLGKKKAHDWQTVPLSTDHKPSLQKEAQRIRKMNGRIAAFKDEDGESIGPLRVWVHDDNVPGLAMTRSFGDLVGASVGVSPIPEIKQFSLSEQDRIIVIGSDGVFEFLQNEQIINLLVPFYQKKQIQQASDTLLNMANRSWTNNSSIIDDITFILIFINYNEI